MFKNGLKPSAYLLRIALAVFLTETAVMTAIYFMGIEHFFLEAVVDSLLLVLLLSPALYSFVYIPLTKELTRRLDAQREIEAANLKLTEYANTLENMVSEKVKDLLTVEQRYTAMLKESALKLDSIIQASPLPIMAIDKKGIVMMWNDTAERVFGWSRDEALGKVNPMVPEDRMDEFLALKDRAVNGESLVNVQVERRKKDGSRIDVSLSTAPLRDSSGEIIGVVAVLEDITERKKADDLILQSKQDWESTFDTITDMITIHDKDFNIIRANKAAKRILGLSLLENCPAKCHEYYHGTDRPPKLCPSCETLKTAAPSVAEVFEPHLDMFVEIRAIPRLDKDNQVIGLIHVVRDITERKKAEEQLNTLLDTVTKAKREWEMTFDSAMEFIVLADMEHRILRCNRSFSDFAGKNPNDIIGLSLCDFLPCNGPEKPCIGGSKGEFVDRKEIRTEGGRWLYVHCRPIHDEKDEFLHSIITVTDITELKEAHHRLVASEGELKARVDELQKFYDMAIGRELRMRELKKEMEKLKSLISVSKN